jgi:HEPN domain-containing protein
MNDDEKNYLQQWKSRANDDLITINRLTEDEVIATSSVCFHCQQLVEKYLKMFLVFHHKDIIKTHEIEFLLHYCPVKNIQAL